MPAGQKRAPDLIVNDREPPWYLGIEPLEQLPVLLTTEPTATPGLLLLFKSP